MKGFFRTLFDIIITPKTILLLLSVLYSSHYSIAQLVTYDFAGDDGSQATNAAASSDANLTVSDMSKGPGITSFNGYPGGFNAYEWGAAATLDANDYYEFTVTPVAGYAMTLTSLEFDDRWVDPNANDTYYWALRSSIDGYSSDVDAPIGSAVTQPGSPDFHINLSFTLPGGTFTDLTTSVTFRLYGYDVTNPGNLELGIDNVDLNGSVSLSPNTLALYNFDGSPGSGTANANALNITPTPFRAVGVDIDQDLGPQTGTFSYQNWADQAAVDLGKYYEFSIAPDAGYDFSLTSLQFKEQREHAAQPTEWQIRSSLDGYTSIIDNGNTTDNSYTTHSIDLTGGTYDNLTTPIAFRIYAYNRSSYNANREWFIDDVILSGSTNAPSKTSIATIDFESVNYTLSSPSSPDGDSFWAVFAASDHGTGHTFTNGPLAGTQGLKYLGYRDGNTVGTNTVVNSSSIDVSTYDNLDLVFSLAATNGVNYEDVDIILIEYQYDGGGYQNLTQWAGNSSPALMTEDSDFSAGGDGVAATQLGVLFKSFTRSIPKNGTLLDIRFTVTTSNEDAIIDNIGLFGSSDITPPEITSIVRQTPSNAVTNASSVTYRVTFNEGVLNVGTGDFTMSGTASGTISTVTPNSATEYDVLVNTVAGDGNLNLDFAGGQDITDIAGVAFAGTINSEEEYTIDNTAPEVTSIIRQSPMSASTTATSVTFRVTFDEPVVNVGTGDFVLSGTASGTISTVTPNSTTEYDVLVNSVSGNSDNMNLDFAGGQDVADNAGNTFAGTINAEEEYTIDNTIPEVTSIIRQVPMTAATAATSVTFRVTFDEPVVNVGTGDFVLSGAASGTISTATPNSTTEYDILVNTVAGDGNLNLDFAGGQDITDVIGNAFGGTINSEEEYTIDNTVPEVTSIIRQAPMTASTTANSVTFRVTFDEPVINVGTGDFVLSGTASGTISTVTPNSTTEYDVLINTVAGDGNLNLDFAGGQDITDNVFNAFAGTINSEEEYTIDNTAPEVTSIIRQSPMSASTTATSVTFRVTFDEPVVNVGTGDFVLSGTASGTISTVTPNSTTEYDVLVNSVSGNSDNLNLDFAGGQDVADNAGNTFAGTINAEEEYTIDNTIPEVTSIIRQVPMTAATAATSVTFRVTFDEPVVNVGTGDFVLSGAASGTISTATPNSTTEYDILVNTVAGDGNLNLDFAGGQDITDVIGNAFGGTINSEEEYTIDNTVPEVTSIIRQAPMTASTAANSVTFRVTFDEPVINVGTGDFVLSGTASGTISTVTPNSTTEYDVLVNTVAGDGNLNLDFAGGQDITDNVFNAFAGTINSEEEYTIDNTAPEVTSIIRQSPMSASTTATSVTFRVTFDEPVVNVGTGDFVLSGTASGTISTVTPNSTTEYDVLVNSVLGNSDNLNLDFAGGQDITDNVTNAFAGTINSEEEYTVDNIGPSVLTTGNVITTGGSVVTNYWNSTNTGLSITVPLDPSDASLDNGSIQIQARVDAGGYENLGASVTILNTDRTNGFKVVSITDNSPANGTPDTEEITGFIEAGAINFRAQVTDNPGNSSTYSVSASIFTIDQTLPNISPNEISFLSSGQLTFTLNEQLNFGPGATTGFSTTDGILSTQNYSGVGTTNLVTLNGSGWSLSTQVNYSGAGNIVDLAGNPMAAFSNQPVILNVINMGAGDLAFTYYRADDPNEFGFVLLKDIPASTQIKFTNNGWNESTTSFRGGEETLTWEADVNYHAGLEVIISSTTPSVGSVTGSTLTLSTSGDQIFAYQGSSATPTFIAGIHNNGGWDGTVDNDQKSTQPSQLITTPPSSFNIDSESDNAGYNRGVLAGTVTEILNDVNSSSNWDTDDNADNGISFTVPTGGLIEFVLPPSVDALAPANGSTIIASTSTLQIDFNENMTKGLVFGGNITISISGGAVIAAIPIGSGLITVNNDIVSIDISGLTLNDGVTYEVDVDGFLFQNADENHNVSIDGATEWSFTADGVAPTVNSINRGTATPLNANFGTTASSVTYTVVFSEDVNPATVTTADFTTKGAASGGTETVSNVTGSGDTYTVTVSSINKLGDLTIEFNALGAGAVSDLVGNVGTTFATGDQSFFIINPEPSQQPTALITAEGANTFTIDLSWTAGAGAQLADGYLILYKTTAGSFPADPTDLIAQGNTFDGTNGVANSASTSISISGLASATNYDFKIYPYTNSGNQIDYKTDGTVLSGSQTTGAGELSTLTLYNLSNTVSSLTNSQADAAALPVANFVVRVIDDGLNMAIDNAPTLISEISFHPDAGNAINWADAIEGAQLDDGTNSWNTDVNGGDIIIDNTQITFSNIPTGSGQLGEILDNGTKYYNLRIWLKSPIPDAVLQNTIDGKRFVFEVDATSFSYETGSSKIEGSQSASSSPFTTYNIVTVVATDLNWEAQPPATAGVQAPFTSTPVIEAVDANGNRDKDYAGAVTTVTNTGTIAMNNNPDASDLALSFASGIYNFDITASTGFNYQEAGDGTLTITSGTLNPSPASDPVAVSYSDGTTITAGGGSEPSTISSLQTGSLLQVFDFTITDDVSPSLVNDAIATRINQIEITPGTGNEITDWSEVIQEAVLRRDLGIYGIASISGTINPTDITFASITNNNIKFPGYVGDDISGTFQLYIRLKSNINAPFSNQIDGQKFVFELLNGGVATNLTGSSTMAASSTDSGPTNNTIDVDATQLVFTQQPPTTVDAQVDVSPQPVVQAQDVNGNRDKNFGEFVVSLSNARTPSQIPMTDEPTSADQFVTGELTFASTFSYDEPSLINGDAALTLTTASFSVQSDPVTVVVSQLSDIIEDGSFTYPTNADFTYLDYDTESDYLEIARFIITDGGDGNGNDSDNADTKLTSLTLNFPNFTSIREVGIFDGGSLVSNIKTLDASGNVTFAGAELTPIVASDNGTTTFNVRVNFDQSVVDNEQFTVQITGAVADPLFSRFADPSAGGAITTLGANDNKIEVDADRLNFTTTPGASLSAFTDVSGFFTVEAQDINGNTDFDYTSTIGAVTTQNFTPTNPLTFNFSPSGNFDLGVYDFSVKASNFQIVTDGLSGELVVSAPTLTDGISSTFDVFASNESDIILDPSFIANDRITTTNNRESDGAPATIARFIIRDGGADLTDADAGNTILKTLDISILNFENLENVGIYDATNTLIEEKTAAATITFDNIGNANGLEITATDIANAGTGFQYFFIKATLKDSPLDDTELIQITLDNATVAGGSQFTPVWVPSVTPSNKNFVDVVAVQYDFTTDPNSVEGVSTALISTPALQAIDEHGNLDIDYSGQYDILTAGAPLNIITGTFTNGLSTITGLQYTNIGDGTLTINENPFTTITNPQPLNVSTDVEIVTTTFVQFDISDYKPQSNTNLSSGATGQALLGFTLDANSVDPTFETHFSSVELNFSEDITDVFENIRLYKVINNLAFLIDVNYTQVPGSVVDGSSTTTNVILNGFDETLDLTNNSTYLIVADISVAASPSSITGPFIDLTIVPKTSYLTPNNGNLTGGNAVSNGFTFTDNRDPEVSAINPNNGSLLAPFPDADYFTITFDEDVYQDNPLFALKRFSDNTVISDNYTVISQSGSEPNKTFNLVFYTDPTLSNVTQLLGGEKYYITLQQSGFRDQIGNTNKKANTGATPAANDISNKGFWAFTTVDTTPPSFIFNTNNSELVDKVYDKGFDLKIKINEPGTIYARVLPDNSNDGDASDIYSSPDGIVTVSNTNEYYYIAIRGLDPNTDYDVYVGAIDVGGNQSTFASNVDNQSVQKVENESTLTSPGPSDPVIISNFDLDICVGEFQPVNVPVSIIESNDDDFSDSNQNIFDIVLPLGYTFKTSVGTVEALPYDGAGDISIQPTLTYTNNSTVRVRFNADNTNDRDEIRVTGLQIKADLSATNNSASINSNFGAFEIDVINLNVNVPGVANFSLDPAGNVINANEANQQILLTQDNPVDEFVGQSYEFAGPGVVNDILYVDLAGLGFKTITLTQTLETGCQRKGSTEINIVNNQFSGLDFAYCSDAAPFQIPVFGTGQLDGYEIDFINVSISTITPGFEADPNSFQINGSIYTFDPSLAIPIGSTTPYVELQFIGEYKFSSDNNIVIPLAQTVRVYPKPTITLTSSTFSDDLDGIIEACEDFGSITGGSDNIIFVGQPLVSSGATGEYILTKNSNGVDASSQITNNNDGSITVNSETLKNTFGAGSYTLVYNYSNTISTCSDFAELELIIYDKPLVDFSTGTSCEESETDFISNISTTESSLTNATYNWDFNDFSGAGLDPNPAHIYNSAGSFNVNLTVTSDEGCVGTITKPLNVGAIPQTVFSFTGVNITDEYNFTSSTPDPSPSVADNIDQYIWEFGDAISENTTVSNTAHTYDINSLTLPYISNAKLTIITTLGCDSTYALPIAILNKYDAATAPSNGFETEDGNSYPEGWTVLTSTDNSWTLSKNNGNIGQDGNTMWVTNPGVAYLTKEQSYVYSPTYDFSSVSRPLISFDAYWDIGTGGGALIQFSTDNLNVSDPNKVWKILGGLESGEDWYNATELSLGNLATGIAWGNTSQVLKQPRHVLDGTGPNSIEDRSNVNFRFALLTSETNPTRSGFAFDNFIIGERTRTVLLENFTNTSETTITKTESDYLKEFSINDDEGTILVKINYHTDFPGFDPLNEVNKVDPSARALFYDVTSTPMAIIDGMITDPEGRPFSQWGETSFNLRSLILAQYKIDLNVTTSGGAINIEAIPTPQNNSVIGKNTIMLAAVLEKDVALGAVPSGEVNAEYVLRKLLPNAAGTVLNTNGASNGQPMAAVNFSWTPNNVADPSNLAVVVIIQDEDTKEVYQSELWLDVPTPETVTSVEEANKNLFSLYPNPASDQLTILLSNKLTQNSTLKIYDNFGKVVFEHAVNESRLVLDTRDFASGMYHVQVTNDDEVIRKRLIISHSDR